MRYTCIYNYIYRDSWSDVVYTHKSEFLVAKCICASSTITRTHGVYIVYKSIPTSNEISGWLATEKFANIAVVKSRTFVHFARIKKFAHYTARCMLLVAASVDIFPKDYRHTRKNICITFYNNNPYSAGTYVLRYYSQSWKELFSLLACKRNWYIYYQDSQYFIGEYSQSVDLCFAISIYGIRNYAKLHTSLTPR